jgi:hypothetical protein
MQFALLYGVNISRLHPTAHQYKAPVVRMQPQPLDMLLLHRKPFTYHCIKQIYRYHTTTAWHEHVLLPRNCMMYIGFI